MQGYNFLENLEILGYLAAVMEKSGSLIKTLENVRELLGKKNYNWNLLLFSNVWSNTSVLPQL